MGGGSAGGEWEALFGVEGGWGDIGQRVDFDGDGVAGFHHARYAKDACHPSSGRRGAFLLLFHRASAPTEGLDRPVSPLPPPQPPGLGQEGSSVNGE